ncbi:MAG TPA: hypothetical protein VFH89_03030 [Sphingomicrobium sp.]|nr:hypothetical protein [Sphingomicrobium sp.]
MRKPALIFAALLLASCGDGNPPSAYKHSRDQFFAVVPLPMVDADFVPCFRTTNGKPGRLADAECYNFTDPQRMRGVAITGFETGSFYPGRTTLPLNGEESDTWVEIDSRMLPANVRNNCKKGCALYLDFVGRRTAIAGRYGHLGVSKYQIVVDRVLRATRLN